MQVFRYFASFNTLSNDPSSSPFLHAPVAYARVTALGSQSLTLADASGLATGDLVETADDGVSRVVTGFVSANRVTVSPSPEFLNTPTSIARFVAAPLVEDYRLAAGSPALGSGMPDPTGASVDPGVFGAPSS